MTKTSTLAPGISLGAKIPIIPDLTMSSQCGPFFSIEKYSEPIDVPTDTGGDDRCVKARPGRESFATDLIRCAELTLTNVGTRAAKSACPISARTDKIHRDGPKHRSSSILFAW